MVLRENYSNEVDNWCLGVLCYEFLVGKPPFESDASEATYQKIKDCSYTFPGHVSSGARDLIQKVLSFFLSFLKITHNIYLCINYFLFQILCKNPRERMSLQNIMTHPWITSNYKPVPNDGKGCIEVILAEV